MIKNPLLKQSFLKAFSNKTYDWQETRATKKVVSRN